ncbi:nickel pincer cofactor biosynthesis protein LarC2 [Velocimicrobium porci]|uniref:LarC family nickel insertion protein n=1 Tax=Velocimicrobium porci TaxID=2606634 RepID=UPI0012B37E7B|nr:LarC family nickel insertion protein [Velocimicrobium porci]
MKLIFLDCSSGVSGNQLIGALYELCTSVQKKNFLTAICSAFPDSEIITPQIVPCPNHSASGLAITVSSEILNQPYWNEEITFSSIRNYINTLPVSFVIRKQIVAIYTLMQKSVSKTRNIPEEQIFFPPLKTYKTIILITGCCLLFSILQPDKIYASPVSLCFGTSSPPVPEMLELLANIPVSIQYSQPAICTLEGVAILNYFVTNYEPLPTADIESYGFGIDSNESKTCLCAILLHKNQSEHDQPKLQMPAITDTIVEIRCNLDDMTPESIGYVSSLLLEQGALDVYTTAIGMKKNRPATMLTCLCKEPLVTKLSHLILLHTATLGIRLYHCDRITLNSEKVPIETSYGTIHFKISKGFGIEKLKPEYEDLRSCAECHNLPLSVIKEEAYRCFYHI